MQQKTCMDEQEAQETNQMEEKVYEMWKRGLPIWEKYRNIVMACRKAMKKAEAYQELNLVKEAKDNTSVSQQENEDDGKHGPTAE